MSSSQFAEWMAYASVEPFGEFRAELRHGQQMALTANLNRDTTRKKEPFQPVDFMNFIERPKETPPPLDFDKIDKEVFGL